MPPPRCAGARDPRPARSGLADALVPRPAQAARARGVVNSLGQAAWRGILAHELAHLRRRDHWVRRLVLIAGLAWWWHPVYWLTRRRLDAEAELACDEWAVAAIPEGRLAYAEALLAVCRSLNSARPPEPALGAAAQAVSSRGESP